MKEIVDLVRGLKTFEDCIGAYEILPAGSEVIDYVFDRMKELDAERFERWLGL